MSLATAHAFAVEGVHHACVSEKRSDAAPHTTGAPAVHAHGGHAHTDAQPEASANETTANSETETQFASTQHDCVHCSAFLASTLNPIEPPPTKATKILGRAPVVRSRIPPRLDRPPKFHA